MRNLDQLTDCTSYGTELLVTQSEFFTFGDLKVQILLASWEVKCKLQQSWEWQAF